LKHQISQAEVADLQGSDMKRRAGTKRWPNASFSSPLTQRVKRLSVKRSSVMREA
jgi:hypothetical protein